MWAQRLSFVCALIVGACSSAGPSALGDTSAADSSQISDALDDTAGPADSEAPPADSEAPPADSEAPPADTTPAEDAAPSPDATAPADTAPLQDTVPATDTAQAQDTTPPAPGPCSGFAAAEASWAVPGASFKAPDATRRYADGKPMYGWVTRDIDGDGLPDLVHADGEATWHVYKNIGGGFAASPLAWAVPAASFTAPDVAVYDAEGKPRYGWVTRDMDGDGRPDLVHADGDVTWRVYKNTGGGFAATPLAWAIPAASFKAPDAARYYADGKPMYGWVTRDVDGDGLPDLVHADGESTWHVYKNTGGGFAASPLAWAIPSSTFRAPDAVRYDADGKPYDGWVTRDMDGDGLPDLVHADGDDVWHVYENVGGGFAAAPVAWAIPSATFRAPDATRRYADGKPAYGWVTRDMDGDGLPDLVHVDGEAAWHVYKNVGNGFAATAMAWTSPNADLRAPDAALYDAVGVPRSGWVTRDMDGDGCLELVHADDTGWSIWDASR